MLINVIWLVLCRSECSSEQRSFMEYLAIHATILVIWSPLCVQLGFATGALVGCATHAFCNAMLVAMGMRDAVTAVEDVVWVMVMYLLLVA